MLSVIRGVGRLTGPLIALAVCAAAVALCLRGADSPVEFSWLGRGGRTTVRLGRYSGLYVTPPVARPGPGGPRAAEVPPLLGNSQILWDVWRNGRQTNTVVFDSFEWSTWRLRGGLNVPMAEIARPLLDGLESPDSFVAAHLALAVRNGSSTPIDLNDQPDGSCLATIDDLTVVLKVRKLEFEGYPDTYQYAATMEVDAGQLDRIRAMWHRRLDARVIVIPTRLVAVAGFLYAALTLFRTFRRLTRSWRGCCRECGYLLYGNTTGICPECGSSTPKIAGF